MIDFDGRARVSDALAAKGVRSLVLALGLVNGYRPIQQHVGLIVRCPAHGDRTPSCSIRVVEGRILVKCFGCDLAGDVFTIIAAAHHLDCRREFPRVMRIGAELAGVFLEPTGRSSRDVSTLPAPVARPAARPARGYPPIDEVEALWRAAVPIGDVSAAAEWARSRSLDVDALELFDDARALRPNTTLPHWARYHGRAWTETGHLVVLRVFDHGGVARSVRAVGVSGAQPKRLPPSGFRAAGLVLANAPAVTWLARPPNAVGTTQVPLIISEGEPDMLTWSTRFGEAFVDPPAVIGIFTGAWSDDIAARIPSGIQVLIRRHSDEAGAGMAKRVAESLSSRCDVRVLVQEPT